MYSFGLEEGSKNLDSFSIDCNLQFSSKIRLWLEVFIIDLFLNVSRVKRFKYMESYFLEVQKGGGTMDVNIHARKCTNCSEEDSCSHQENHVLAQSIYPHPYKEILKEFARMGGIDYLRFQRGIAHLRWSSNNEMPRISVSLCENPRFLYPRAQLLRINPTGKVMS